MERGDLQSQHPSQGHWGTPTVSLSQEWRTSSRFIYEIERSTGRQEVGKERGEGRKKRRRRREIWALWCVSDRQTPSTDPQAPRGRAAETLSTAAQPETTLHTVTMVIIRWNCRDYNSSGTNILDTHTNRATVRMRKTCSYSAMFIMKIYHHIIFRVFSE